MAIVHIFGGCSFTDMPGSWARVIIEQKLNKHRGINIAKSGAGNKFIASAVCSAALQAELEGFTPDISVMWSSPTRVEFPLHSKESPYYKHLFTNNKQSGNDMNPGFYAKHSSFGELDRDENNWWILNGGNVSEKTRWANNTQIDMEYVEAFRSYQKYFSNSNLHWHDTLHAILQVQNLCKSHKWNYRFTTFRAYVNEWQSICPKQFKPIQNDIEWDRFVFTDSKDGGLREYTLNTLNTWDDGYDNHPSHEVHKHFVDNFWLPQFTDVYA